MAGFLPSFGDEMLIVAVLLTSFKVGFILYNFLRFPELGASIAAD